MANRPVQKKKNKRTVSPFTVLLLVTAVLTVLAVALLVYQNFDADTGGKTLIKDERAGDYFSALRTIQVVISMLSVRRACYRSNSRKWSY